MEGRKMRKVVFLSFLLILSSNPFQEIRAQDQKAPSQAVASTSSKTEAIDIGDAQPSNPPSESKWHYGGFFDVGYLLDFNHPANRVFRSRGTTWHVDRPQINMAAVYLRKKATEESRWG